MALPAWYWPASGQSARGVSLVAFGGLLIVPDWTTPTLWPFSVSGATFLTPLATFLASGNLGFAAAASGFTGVLFAHSGLVAVTYSGGVWMGGLPWPPSFAATIQMPSGRIYVGCACPSNGNGYVIDALGAVSVIQSGSVASGAVATFPTNAWSLAASGTTLATLLPASGIGLMTTGGVSGLIALPAGIATPSCLAMGSGTLAIGGWTTAPSLLGAAAAMLDPQDSLTMAAVGSGFARLWRTAAASGEAWSQTQVLSGLAVLNSLSWRPDGTQVLAASPLSGAVQVLAYGAGSLSLSQTLTVASACAVAVAGTSTDAIVVQSGATHVTPLVYSGGSWATGATVGALPFGGTGVAAAPFGPSGVVVAHTAGATFLSLTTGGWVIGSSEATTPVTALAVDQFLRVYYAGQGFVAMSSGLTGLVVSGSLPGMFGPSALAVQEGRIAVADTTDNTFYIYGQDTPTTLAQEVSGTLFMGLQPVGLALSATTLFTMGSASTVLTGFSGSITTAFTGSPFAISTVLSGAAAQWNGSSWTTTGLGVGHLPACCGFDPSGNLVLATVQNTLWTISGGVGTSGILQQYPGQTQAVPLTVSALLSSGGHLYGATSLPGVLTEIE